MNRTASVVAGQHESHAVQATNAGLQHGETSEVEVTVGVTREDERTVRAHGCSSRMKRLAVIRHGDGTRIPLNAEYQTRYDTRLPHVQQPVILRAKMNVTPNGQLTFSNAREVKVVLVPASIVGFSPWAYDGGAEEVAGALGCSSLDEMFERHGQTVEV